MQRFPVTTQLGARMGPTRALHILMVAAILAGCARTEKTADTLAAAGPDTAASSSTAPTSAGASASGAISTASASSVGRYLTDANGRALYMFVKDSKNVSTCTDACAQAWPPFGPTGAAGSDTLVKAAMISTITRSDNRSQATYNGMPLYYYEDDKNPGDIKGQGKNEFGGLWYTVSPGGQRIAKKG